MTLCSSNERAFWNPKTQTTRIFVSFRRAGSGVRAIWPRFFLCSSKPGERCVAAIFGRICHCRILVTKPVPVVGTYVTYSRSVESEFYTAQHSFKDVMFPVELLVSRAGPLNRGGFGKQDQTSPGSATFPIRDFDSK